MTIALTADPARASIIVNTRPRNDRSADDIATRKAPIDGVYNAVAVTIGAVIATDTPVQRQDSRGPFFEVLDPFGLAIEPGADFPLLDSHRQNGVASMLGRVHNVTIENHRVMADLRLSQADDVEPIRQRLADGTLNSCSVGYAVRRWRETVDPHTKIRTRTAIEWRILEVSLVAIPADPKAKRRSASMTDELEDVNTMPDDQQTAIRSLGELADLPPSWAAGQIEADASIEDARRAARTELTTRSQSARIRVASPAVEDPAVRLRTLEDALFARTTGSAPTDAARTFMGHSLRDFARETLHVRGIATVGLDTDQLFRAAMHTTSDFPQLLQGVGSRTLLPAYQAAQSPLKSVLARQALRTDFRQGSKLRLGELGMLQKVSEAGEIKSTTRAESASSYALDTYGSIFTISRKALISDDLGAFRDWATAAGQAAAQTEAALLWSLLTQSGGAGPTMDDNKRLFHADHGNLNATGSALMVNGVKALSNARKALRSMKGLDGKTPIAVTPKYLLVGPSRETEAEKLLTVINAAQTGDANPFAGKLTLLVEPRITDDSWYVFADPAQLPVLEYAYLSDAQGPQFASREGFEVLATEFRVTLDFGAGAVDWRGAYRDVGNTDPDA